MADLFQVLITGDRELERELHAAARALPRATREIGLDVADAVAAVVRRKVPVGPGENGHVRSSIEGRAVAGLPSVTGGGGRFPYFGWLEFGGHVGIRNSVFRPYRDGGRYIYPTTYQHRPRTEEIMDDGLTGFMRRRGFEVI